MTLMDPLAPAQQPDARENVEAEVLIAEARRRARRRRGGYSAAAALLVFAGWAQLTNYGSAEPAGSSPAALLVPSNPAVVAAGSQIAFGIYTGSHQELYVMNADGSGLRLLTRWRPMFDGAGDHTWSPDGRQIAYMTTSGDRWIGGSEKIAVVNVDGSGERVLTDHPASVSEQGHAWSPDGQQILFTSGSYSGYDIGLHVVNASGSGERLMARVTRQSIKVGTPFSSLWSYDVNGAWSPDGRRILYWAQGEIFVVNPDGTGVRKLGDGGVAAWSPDGQRIAFARDNSVWVMNADGKTPRRLSSGGTFGDGLLHGSGWSPDGSQILFMRFVEEGQFPDPPGFDWYVINADGSGERLVAPDANGVRPAWSPDSQQMALSTNGGVIHVINADGTGEQTLRGEKPAWSPDGQQIAFARDHSVWIMNADGTDQRRLTPPMGQDYQPAISWSSVAPVP